VVRRHRLIELFLVNVLKMDWAEVHEDAEALEHAVSSRVLDRMDAMMGHPGKDPHGDPIPGNTSGRPDSRRIDLLQAESGSTYEVSRVENQNPEVLERIATLGLKPGTSFRPVRATESGEAVDIEVDSTTVSVPAELAGWIRVKAIS
jgi:DtxR family Mn-dependent transcriptional regulator